MGRVVLVVALLLSIPAPRRTDVNPSNDVNATIDRSASSSGSVLRTLPQAADIIGYRGPTEAMIALDGDLNIVAVEMMSSADTAEHVDAIRRDVSFFEQFRGWPWGGPPSDLPIDGVSGATLTSLALAQGVIKRIGGDRPSLVFPDELQEVDANRFRTGPYSDSIVGYQGPTELVVTLGSSDAVEGIRINRSYDNEPYVDYVRQEKRFWKKFTGRTLEDLATMNPQDERIEGVSGATMTSMAVAETLVAASAEYLNRKASQAEVKHASLVSAVRWTPADVATISMLLLAVVLSRFSVFRSKRWRRAWLVVVVLVIGFWAGNLLSLALMAGWSAGGVAWRLAPGLAAIAAVALLIPPITKANPYCNHLCPHGAIQQLIKPARKARRRLHVPRRLNLWLGRIPGAILIVAYIALLIMPSLDLASWEPFHAYLFRIAGWSSILFAIASLLFAAVLPMGYCRMGCPTGRLIDYVRREATSDQFKLADTVAIALLALAWIIQF